MTSSVRVERVDPFDARAFARWYDTFAAGLGAGRADPSTQSYDETRVLHQRSEEASQQIALVALANSGVVGQSVAVGAAELVVPRKDNLTLLMFDLGVPEEFRRRGYGTALLDAIVDLARELGRTSLLTETNDPPESLSPDAELSAGRAFATRHGFAIGNTELRRRLDLPVPADRLDSLAGLASERTGGYTLRSWEFCPDEFLDQYAALKARLSTDAPMGDLDYEPEHWDAARVRAAEERIVAQGRKAYTTVAIGPDGTLAGHSRAIVTPSIRKAYQQDTLVSTEHRGHRLGLALKVANLRALQAGSPDTTAIYTWNAAQNGPMIHVNEQLGFRIDEVSREWQRDRDPSRPGRGGDRVTL